MPAFQWALMEANLDPAAGAEQKGTRPVLIVSNEEFNQAMPNVTVLPLTSTRRRLYPSEAAAQREGQSTPGIHNHGSPDKDDLQDAPGKITGIRG